MRDTNKAKEQLVSVFNTENLTEEQLADAYNLRRALFEVSTFLGLVSINISSIC